MVLVASTIHMILFPWRSLCSYDHPHCGSHITHHCYDGDYETDIMSMTITITLIR